MAESTIWPESKPREKCEQKTEVPLKTPTEISGTRQKDAQMNGLGYHPIEMGKFEHIG